MFKSIGLRLMGLGLALMAAGAGAAPAIQPFETDSLAHIVASQKGKPFVLVLWSLECEYCQASLNNLAHDKHLRKDLNVITLSTDALEDEQTVAAMRKKLAGVGLSANAWALGSAPAEQLRYAVDPKWHGEVPRSYWFNAKGEKKPYSGVLTPAVIDKLAHDAAMK